MSRTIAPKARAQTYRTALYARLSVDDRSIGTSYSISNQINLMSDYVGGCDDLEACGIYADDGISGSTFERPDWIRLMSDVQAGKIDCIVVKDLSRLGRNYLETCRLLDRELPALGVRVIAITDNYDSACEKTASDYITVLVKNLFNDMYCRDSSVKTKASLSAKRRRGDFTGSFAPYGYMRGTGPNRHKLVVDEEAAGVVRDIFDWRVMGLTPAGIAERLNVADVPCPFEYARRRGQYRSANFVHKCTPSWDARIVIRVLENEAYIGVMCQGKTYKPDFRSHVVLPRDQSEWDRVEGTHEPIVDAATFALVQKLAERDARRSPKSDSLLPFSGFLFCADCGATMARRTVRNKSFVRYYYTCETHRKDRACCSMHKVWESALEESVLEAVHACATATLDGMAAHGSSFQHRRDRKADLLRRAQAADSAIERAKELRLHLYADFADEVIGRDEYQDLARGIDARLASLTAERTQASRDIAQLEGGADVSWHDLLKRHRSCSRIDRLTVVELIDKVLVSEGGDVEVIFRFGDPYRTSGVGGDAA